MKAHTFFGRSPEIDALLASLEEGVRLVTLVGPGGIGKTALAAEVAGQAVARGIVERTLVARLDSVEDEGGIVDAVALACGATLDAGGDAIARVGAALAGHGRALLVVDDFDGLVPHAMATLGAWLELAPEIAILVTSRERLALAAEHVTEVGPLGVEGLALLVGAARRAHASFALRPGEEADAEDIVRTLEGVPLALELAGARLPLFGARALGHRLRTREEPLRREGRGAAARHASLDAAVRDSFEGLAPAERDVLAQLTVFHGGFTAEAVGSVCVGEPDPVTVLEVLRARSLVRSVDHPTGARFDLYGAIRAFVAREHPGPIAAAAQRHARWFLERAEAAARDAHHDAIAHAFLVDERDNVLAVARRVLEGGLPTAREAEPALRAMVALHPVLASRGPLTALAAALTPLVDRTRDSGADPRLSARVSILRGALRRDRGELKAALKDLLAAESVARAVDDAILVADAVLELGRTVLFAGEIDAAREHFDRAARAFAERGARGREGEATLWLGVAVAAAGKLVDARNLVERAAALAASDRMLAPLAWLTAARAAADMRERSAAHGALANVAAGDDLVAVEASLLRGHLAWDVGDEADAAKQLAGARDRANAHGLAAEAAIAQGFLGALGGGADAYPSLALAHDVATREGRREAAAIFGALLALADAGASRPEAARATLERAAHELALPRRAPLAPWPLGAAWIVSFARAFVERGPDALDAAVRDATAAGPLPLVARNVLSRFANAKPPPSRLPEDALVVGDEGAWFRAPAPQTARVGLERRRSLALLVHRLAVERLAKPGATLGAAELFAAAWPGEKAIASAAAHRVRVAIATLRKMGLRDALVTTPDGYAFSASVPLVRA